MADETPRRPAHPRALAEHDVDYVIVGGLAVQTHGHVRTTVDIDVYRRADAANLQRLADALNELGARSLNAGSEDLTIDGAMLPRVTLWQFDDPARQLSKTLVHDAPGAPPANAQLRERALAIELDGIELAVAGLDDLTER